MKTTGKINDLKKLTTRSELDAQLMQKKNELFNLRFQQAIGQLDNTAAIRECRRDIARVKTFIRQLELKDEA